MEATRIDKIKAAIKSNFEQSPSSYQAFEDAYGFFTKLNEVLLSRMKLPPSANVLDIGCGTGASSAQITRAFPECRVWGLDYSPAMLEMARKRHGESDRLRFLECDAARMQECIDASFDAILYSASIFLIPDYEESLSQARSLLDDGGQLGLTFLDGVYDGEGSNLLAIADLMACEGVSLKKPVNIAAFEDFFSDLFPRHTLWNEDFRLPVTLLQAFFSVPAMSAGLFPGVPYEERVRKVHRLFDCLPETSPIFRWIMMVGEKTG